MAERAYPWLALRFEFLRSGELAVRWRTHDSTRWSRAPTTADSTDAGVPIPVPPDLAGVAVSLWCRRGCRRSPTSCARSPPRWPGRSPSSSTPSLACAVSRSRGSPPPCCPRPPRGGRSSSCAGRGLVRPSRRGGSAFLYASSPSAPHPSGDHSSSTSRRRRGSPGSSRRPPRSPSRSIAPRSPRSATGSHRGRARSTSSSWATGICSRSCVRRAPARRRASSPRSANRTRGQGGWRHWPCRRDPRSRGSRMGARSPPATTSRRASVRGHP